MKNNSLSQNEIPLKNETGLAGLVIDMQPHFLNEIEENERKIMIQSQIELIHYLSVREAPIFVLEYEDKGRTIKKITREINFSKNEKPIIKTENSGFINTRLQRLLKKYSSKNLIFMGINASSCVAQTAEDAKVRGYKIFTARNLIAEKEEYNDREMEQMIKKIYTNLGTFFRTEKGLVRFLEKSLSSK